MALSTPATSLDSIPHEILEHVAFFSATESSIGPPSALPILLSVNRRLNTSLSLPSNPHLYARIFAAKFDASAPIRRLGANELTVMALATELKRRCTILKRIRAKLDCLVVCPHMRRGEEEPGMLDSILWVAYLMMLENDGKNEAQLREYAKLDDWLLDFWFHSEGSSRANLAIDAKRWPQNSTQTALAMWLFWFLLQPGKYLQDEDVYRRVLSILKPLALGAHVYNLCRPTWVAFLPTAHTGSSVSTVDHYSDKLVLTPAPLAAPAILAYLSLANHQLTMSSNSFTPVTPLALPSSPSPTGLVSPSEKWDYEWLRCLTLGTDPYPTTHARAFKPGSLQGVWEGMFTYTEFTAYAALLSGAGPQVLQKSLIAQHRQTWKLREHHLLTDVSFPPDAPPEAPLAPGDPLRGYLPADACVHEGPAGVEAHTPGRAPVFYRRFSAEGVRAHEKGAAEGGVDYDAKVQDILITGDGHSAWGQFSLTGRVRPCDGFISISKEYVAGDRGKWLYRGYLVGTKDGNLAGRWRDTLSPAEVHGYEGCFGMSRRR